jgi:hypothetical protein
MANKRKRAVVIADLHCGHKLGLCHPDFDATPTDTQGVAYRLWSIRRVMFRFYEASVERLKPIDLLIVNGDAIDGKGQKTGGTELLTTDRDEQCDNAAALIDMWKTRRRTKVLMSYGTSYHTGADEDWENQVAKTVGAEKIGGEDTADVNGLLINYRHFISSSSIPHGRYTPIAREKLWNLLWSEYGEFPKADVIIRSHVHYFAYAGGFRWLGIITPALQFMGTKYGARRMSNTVDLGLIHIDVNAKDDYTWKAHILKVNGRLKPKVIVI